MRPDNERMLATLLDIVADVTQVDRTSLEEQTMLPARQELIRSASAKCLLKQRSGSPLSSTTTAYQITGLS